MIETKEQYERLKAEAQNLGYIALEGTGVHIIETIEALRKVARYGQHSKECVVFVRLLEDCTCGFAEANNALADWLTDG